MGRKGNVGVPTGALRITGSLALCLASCAYLQFPESRPPALIGAPGAPRPDGCSVDTYLAVTTAPIPVHDIGTISAVATLKENCVEYLIRHEACHYGGDVLYGLQAGEASLGQDIPTWWCVARLARRHPVP
jgi:hypothetical protein